MKLYRILVLLLSVQLAGNFAIASVQPFQECRQVDAKVETTDSSNGRDNGVALVTITRGSTNDAKFIFCEQAGKVLNEGKFSINKIDNLKKGEYFCIVSTRECSKKVIFSIN
jgi:hypothetical protein